MEALINGNIKDTYLSFAKAIYPTFERLYNETGLSSKVIIKLIINDQGKVIDLECIKPQIDNASSKELLKEFQKDQWIPAKIKGKNVCSIKSNRFRVCKA
ncbi:hypothetical protein [Algivirga pacifica]|uniref:TonB C-terminal domain-containing protein n=1 Tax=Algivirga pacifica TaxID=1162670 RepID=A0ABP9D9V3_9BACT